MGVAVLMGGVIILAVALSRPVLVLEAPPGFNPEGGALEQ